jgi:poly-gamma-glutamate synthesis protein (capsule biosynthesis protein)
MSNRSGKLIALILLFVWLFVALTLVAAGCGARKGGIPPSDSGANPARRQPPGQEPQAAGPDGYRSDISRSDVSRSGPRSGTDEANPGPESAAGGERVYTATLAAVGDVLIHSSIYKDARTKDGYDFTPIFSNVKRYIEDADLAVANQESMIGGEELGLSDYPRFNSPYEVGDALKDAGFDIVNLANNHTLDRGAEAVTNAIRHWRELGIIYTGAHLSEEDRRSMRIVDKNGISFAFLSYTYGTNGIPVPPDKPYLVNLIDLPAVADDIAQARRLADVVVVNAHFGQEYAAMPNEQQKQFARTAAEAGADIVIGHHPHVLQPAEWIETASGRRTFVAYSLGNFIAAQEGVRKRTGGILRLEVEKKVVGRESRIEIRRPSFIPTWVSMKNWRQFRIVPLSEAEDALLPDAKAYVEEIKNHMSRWMPELAFPEQ